MSLFKLLLGLPFLIIGAQVTCLALPIGIVGPVGVFATGGSLLFAHRVIACVAHLFGYLGASAVGTIVLGCVFVFLVVVPRFFVRVIGIFEILNLS